MFFKKEDKKNHSSLLVDIFNTAYRPENALYWFFGYYYVKNTFFRITLHN